MSNSSGKAIALYKYLKEFSSLKFTKIVDVNKQHWHVFLNDIPIDPENIKIYSRDKYADYEYDSNVILEIRKPEYEKCPKPDKVIINWIDGDWDDYKSNISIKPSSSELGENLEIFEISPERVEAMHLWLDSRDKWVARQKTIEKTRDFFMNLYNAYIDLNKEPETLEFVVGNGLFRHTHETSINHPVLIKKIDFEFDSKNNIIKIVDTDNSSYLYEILLHQTPDLEDHSLDKLIKDLEENEYHPLDNNDTKNFMKSLTYGLSPKSKFIDSNEEDINDDAILKTYWKPVFFIQKRIDGTPKVIDQIIHNIEVNNYVPTHLLNIVGENYIQKKFEDKEYSIEEQLANISGESIDILLSKPANSEQLEIAKRIEYHDAVLVQGPPGTGKTHTIANLIGHFLSQGKSVLITSHTKKALSVLKDQVPESIKPLCVSVLDDSYKDMEKSINDISEYISRTNLNTLEKSIKSTEKERENIIDDLSNVRRKIYKIKYSEFKPIVYNGNSYSPSEAAKFVAKNKEYLNVIPGKVKPYEPLPATNFDLEKLYSTNDNISPFDEKELDLDIPDPKLLISPHDFKEIIGNRMSANEELESIKRKLSFNIEFNFQDNCIAGSKDDHEFLIARNIDLDTIKDLEGFINNIISKLHNSTEQDAPIPSWIFYAVADGKAGGNSRKKWENLINSITETYDYVQSLPLEIINKKIDIDKSIDIIDSKTQITELANISQKNNILSGTILFFKPHLRNLVDNIKINGKKPTSVLDFELILKHIELLEMRQNLSYLWDELIYRDDFISYDQLSESPEEICYNYISTINYFLDWYENEFKELDEMLKSLDFNKIILCEFSVLDSNLVKVKKIFNFMDNKMPIYINLLKLFMEQKNTNIKLNELINILEFNKRKESKICNDLKIAIKDEDHTLYERSYNHLIEIFSKRDLQIWRREILNRISSVAPSWANAISNREGIHSKSICPEKIDIAWQCKQFNTIIEEINAESLDELQKKSLELSVNLRKKTEELAANKAWLNLLIRTQENIEMKQALSGWKLLMKKIGKGTGKNAPKLRKEAKEHMAKCQNAVPAWIMTINTAMVTLDPCKNIFDVIIIDEASQSDITAIAITYFGKKIIVVGDDKQVSPMSIGVDTDEINALARMHIKDLIPNWSLYDAKTSLYDISSMTYDSLMLREHFRCMPDIIGYSNYLSYDYKIKPLRDKHSCNIFPNVVSHRVEMGARTPGRKTNQAEALEIVSLISACIEQPEYDNKTFGVISLLGDDQSKLIQNLLLEKLPPTVIEERRIVCGNASNFQGDERNIIFLSMVDSNEGDGPLYLRGEGAEQSTKQRYNVATSRAKDQLWIVHSLDYTKDLKEGDIRRDLLQYADNPSFYIEKSLDQKSESEFEKSVAGSLLSAGYNITQQWEVGSYRIDIVVQYGDRKIAIECDGDSYHSSEEQIRKDLERQTILERLGWRFIRIRGSEYYSNPELTMKRVYSDLKEFGIFTEELKVQKYEVSSVLLENIKIRANQIRMDWENGNNTTPKKIKEDSLPYITNKKKQMIQEYQ